MAAGDVNVYGPTTPDKLDALMTGNVVVADDFAICSIGGGLVVVVVVKAV